MDAKEEPPGRDLRRLCVQYRLKAVWRYAKRHRLQRFNMIQVNQARSSEAALMAEMQYHPASDKRGAMLKAAESLIIGELLRQRAKALGFSVKSEANTASDDNFLDALINTEVAIPTASQEECEQY